MGQLVIYAFLMLSSVASLVRPWMGVVAAYLIVVLSPQSVWWWNFEGVRPALWVSLPLIVGFLFGLLKNKYDLSILRNKRNVFLLILWAAYTLSYYAGPYVDMNGPGRITDPSWAFSTINKIFVLYFIACVCIDDVRKVKILAYVLIGSGMYLIYWANNQYFSGHVYGRIGGPSPLGSDSFYTDENNFAMLFVVILPFIWYLGFTLERKVLRWGMWLFIPFGWHAIFLTGSRGGLVGIAATLVLTIWRSSNRKFAVLLLPAFLFAYMWQAGDVMRERASTMSDYQTEQSAQGRLQAWGAAMNMIAAHPITGVGLSAFVPAFPNYSDHHPREAHNTFFQIAGESGIIAGAMYLAIIGSALFGTWRNGQRLRQVGTENIEPQPFEYWLNEAILVGFGGLVVCSMFLSLQLFEVFYIFCVMINAMLFAGAGKAGESR